MFRGDNPRQARPEQYRRANQTAIRKPNHRVASLHIYRRTALRLRPRWRPVQQAPLQIASTRTGSGYRCSAGQRYQDALRRARLVRVDQCRQIRRRQHPTQSLLRPRRRFHDNGSQYPIPTSIGCGRMNRQRDNPSHPTMDLQRPNRRARFLCWFHIHARRMTYNASDMKSACHNWPRFAGKRRAACYTHRYRSLLSWCSADNIMARLWRCPNIDCSRNASMNRRLSQ